MIEPAVCQLNSANGKTKHAFPEELFHKVYKEKEEFVT